MTDALTQVATFGPTDLNLKAQDPDTPPEPFGPPEALAGPYTAAEKSALGRFKSGEQAAQLEPSAWDKYLEMAGQTSEKSTIGFIPGHPGSVLRAMGEWSIKSAADYTGQPTLTPEEAKRQYGLDVSEPILPYIAAQRAARRDANDRIVQDLNRGGAPGFGLNLAAGLTGGLDPGFLIAGGLVGGVARGIGLGEGLVSTYLQNVATMTAAEGVTAGLESHEGAAPPTSFADRAEGVLTGAAVGTALHFGLNKLFPKKVIPPEFPAGLTQGEIERLVNEMRLQQENGKPVTGGPTVAESELRRAGNPNDGYTFQTYANPATEGKWYAGYQGHQDTPSTITWELPGALQVGDRSSAVHGAVADPYYPVPGRVVHVLPFENTKVLSGSDPIRNHPKLLAAINSILKEHGIEYTPGKTIPEDATVRDVIDQAHVDSTFDQRGLDAVATREERLALARGLDPEAFDAHERIQSHLSQLIVDEMNLRSRLGESRPPVLDRITRLREINEELKTPNIDRATFDRLNEEERTILKGTSKEAMAKERASWGIEQKKLREDIEHHVEVIDSMMNEHGSIQERISDAYREASRQFDTGAATPIRPPLTDLSNMMESIRKTLIENGVDAIHTVHEFDGEPRYNTLHILDPEKVLAVSSEPADIKKAFTVDHEARQAWVDDTLDPEKPGLDEKAQAEITQAKDGSLKKQADEQAEAYQNFLDQTIKSASKDSPEIVKKLEDLKKLAVQDQRLANELDEFSQCLIRENS